MMLARLMLILVFFVLAACGRSSSLTCDEGPYLAAVDAPRVQAPEDLDNLNRLNEVPLPEASPREPRPADGPCLESPPQIIRID